MSDANNEDVSTADLRDMAKGGGYAEIGWDTYQWALRSAADQIDRLRKSPRMLLHPDGTIKPLLPVKLVRIKGINHPDWLLYNETVATLLAAGVTIEGNG